jgi:hypothetical protein
VVGVTLSVARLAAGSRFDCAGGAYFRMLLVGYFEDID